MSYSNTALTELELTALNGILESQYMNGVKGHKAIGHHVWSWSANPFENRKQFSGACSMLHQKGLIERTGEGASRTIALTKEGYDALLAASKPAGRKAGKPAAMPPRKPVEAPKPPGLVRLPARPWEAPRQASSRPAVIVTAKPPRKRGRPMMERQQEPETSKPTIQLGSIIKLAWRDRVVVAEIIAETEKAWKLVALDQNNQNGFECWFAKAGLEHIENSTYKLADWFIERNNSHGNYTMSWLWHNSR